MAAFCWVYDSRHRRLTAKHRDQLRNPTLSNHVWATFTFCSEIWYQIPDVFGKCIWFCCLEAKGERNQNCSVICCVWQLCKMICTQMWAVLKFICQSDLNFVVCLVLVMHLMCITVIVICVFMSFSALTLLVGQQAEHPACKNWVMRCWYGYLSGADCLHMVQLMPLPSRNPIIPCLI